FHAEVVRDGGRWWLRDTNSTNGLYLGGERTERVPLDGPVAVRLGREGPLLRLDVQESAAASPPAASSVPEEAAADPSLSQLIGHYFEGDSGPAGERTMMIRQAYRQVQEKQQRAYGGVIGAVAALLLVALGFAAWQ